MAVATFRVHCRLSRDQSTPRNANSSGITVASGITTRTVKTVCGQELVAEPASSERTGGRSRAMPYPARAMPTSARVNATPMATLAADNRLVATLAPPMTSRQTGSDSQKGATFPVLLAISLLPCHAGHGDGSAKLRSHGDR